MASSSTFRINDNKWKDRICFAEMMRNMNAPVKKIYIEKKKQFYSKQLISEYLEDLKKVVPYNGFKIKKRTIVVDVSNITSPFQMRLLSIPIRYLWEGKYPKNAQDNFFHIVEGYFKLKKYYPSHTVTKNLCLAHAYAAQYMGFVNTNHMWGRKYGTLIKDEIIPSTDPHKKDYIASVTGSDEVKLPEGFVKPKRWTKKKFDELLKHYEQYK